MWGRETKQGKYKEGKWGEWETCSPMCGMGQRSRERCTQKHKHDNECAAHGKTTQTEQCSSVACSLTSSNVQAWSSRENKASISLGTASSEVMTSRYDVMTPYIAVTSRPLAVTSSELRMTSASVPGVIMLSTHQVLWTSSASLTLLRPSVTETTPRNKVLSKTEPPPTSSLRSLAISPSLAVMLSSSSMMSPLMMFPSTILESPALVMASSPVSKTADPTSPNKANQGPMESLSSRHAYFKTGRKDGVLLNHRIKRMWTPSVITCAMLCIRHQSCQSFNFKCSEQDSNQLKDVNTEQHPNCQLNSAKHSTHPRDFFSKKGYCYFYL